MTTWRRSDSFYQGAYPNIAYAGALEREDRERSGKTRGVRRRFGLGGGGAARAFDQRRRVRVSLNVADVCECDYMLKLMYRDALGYALPRLQALAAKTRGRAKDVLTDIYDYVSEIWLNLRIQRLGISLFDSYETGRRDVSCLLGEAEEIARALRKLKRTRTDFGKNTVPESKAAGAGMRRNIKITRTDSPL